MIDDKLTSEEQSKMAECEAAIERILGGFYETGGALQKIRDERLYRTTYATFEKYCQGRWDMSRTHANRTIEASSVVANLAPIGAIPTTESQARELAGLTPEEQRKVWQKVLKTAPDGVITAAHIRETREALLGPRRNPVQGELFTLEDYREAIKDHVDAANHHHHEGKHHRREEKHHRHEAIRLRDEAFKKFGVQLDLPFDDDQNSD